MITVVIPTYNERENLPYILEPLISQGLKVLVVDDNSPDGTGALADELAARNPDQIHVMHRAGKQGLGTAYVQGFGWALNHGADVVIQMDADFSHDPKDLPRLIDALDDPAVDFVIGSRYVQGGRLDERWGAGRRLLSWFANRVWVDLILGIGVRDCTAGFRAWKRETLLGMGLETIQSNGYFFQVEMTYRARRRGYRALEVPIYFAERRCGQSKMSSRVQLEAALGVIKLRLRG